MLKRVRESGSRPRLAGGRPWVELCAGTAALTFRSRGLMPPAVYLGSKKKYAAALLEILGEPEGECYLIDSGLWPAFYRAVQTYGGDAVADVAATVPMGKPGFMAIQRAPVPDDPVVRAAYFICLQQGAVLGKAVRIVEGRWKTAGYASLSPSAIRKGFRDRLNPPVLAEKVRALDGKLGGMHFITADVRTYEPIDNAVVFFDPPYLGKTGYGRMDPTRPEVVQIAYHWLDHGCDVAVSEGEPAIPGWNAIEVTKVTDKRRGKQKHEWLSVSWPLMIEVPEPRGSSARLGSTRLESRLVRTIPLSSLRRPR